MAHKALVSLIAKGRRARRPAEHKEIAFGLADLSGQEDLLPKYEFYGGIKTLLSILIKTLDSDAQRFASLALANVASLVKNGPALMREGAVAFFIEYIQDNENDIIARQYCAMAIGNIAVDKENHKMIIENEGIESLIVLLQTQDSEGGKYAAFALGNLACELIPRQLMVEKDCISGLIYLACCEDLLAQKQALITLKTICLSYNYLSKMIDEGILDPLILLSRNDHDLELLRETAMFFNVLSTHNDNKKDIAYKGMISLVALMMHTDPIVEQNAIAAVANIMEIKELHMKLLEEKGLVPVVALAMGNDVICRGDACRCISNVALNPIMHIVLVQEDAISPLVECLDLDDLYCQRYAALGLANMLSETKTQLSVVERHALNGLLNLCEDNDAHIEGRRYALLALANLSATPGNHVNLIEARGIEIALSIYQLTDIMTQYYLSIFITNLSASKATHSTLTQYHVFPILAFLCDIDDLDIYTQGIIAMRNLAINDVQKRQIVLNHGLDILLNGFCLDNLEMDLCRHLIACLNNLSSLSDNKPDIVQKDFLSILLKLLFYNDDPIVIQTLSTLANLAELPVCQDIISTLDIIKQTIVLMRSTNIPIQCEAGRVISNICSSKQPYVTYIIDCGGHNLLISYILSPASLPHQRVGVIGICNLSTQRRFHKILMKCGIIEPIISILRQHQRQHPYIVQYILLTVSNLASTFENHTTFLEEGILAILLALASSTHPKVIMYAAYTIVKFGHNYENRERITDEGGLPPILYLSQCDDDVAVMNDVIKALCNLSYMDINKTLIGKDKNARKVCIQSTLSPDYDIKRIGVCTLANLAEYKKNWEYLEEEHIFTLLTESQSGIVYINDDNILIECIRLIGNLAMNYDYAQYFAIDDVLKILLPLLESLKVPLRRTTYFALCNISTCSKTHNILIHHNILTILFKEAKMSLFPDTTVDLETSRYALLCLCNLSLSKDEHNLYINKVLPILASYSTHRDNKCRQYAVFCLSNLCWNPANLAAIMKSKCLHTIINFSFPTQDDTGHVQFQAIGGLRGLASPQTYTAQLIRDGILEPLLIAVNSADVDVQREAAATLLNLSLTKANTMNMLTAGCLAILKKYLQNTDIPTKIYAMTTIANMCELVAEDSAIHERYFYEVLLRICIRLTNELQEIDLIIQMNRCFSLLASRIKSHRNLLENTDLIPCITTTLSTYTDVNILRYGVMAIANLSVTKEFHSQMIISKVFEQLNVLITMSDIDTKKAIAYAYHRFVSNTDNHTYCESIYIAYYISTLVQDENRDVFVQAILAIRKLAASYSNTNHIIYYHGIANLCQHVKDDDIEIRREVGAALRNIALHDIGKVNIVSSNSLLYLYELMHINDTDTCYQSTITIANISEELDKQNEIIDSGALQHLKFASRSTDLETQREATRALANLACNITHAMYMISEGIMTTFMLSLTSADYLNQRYAALGISNLAITYDIQPYILADGPMKTLVALFEYTTGDLESQRYATIALANFSALLINHDILNEYYCIQTFIKYFTHTDIDIRNSSALAIGNIATNTKYHRSIIDTHCLPTLITFLHESNTDTMLKLHTVSIFRGLTISETVRFELLTYDCIVPLLKLYNTDVEEIRTEVLMTLCNIALSGCISKYSDVFLENITIKDIINLVYSTDTPKRLFGLLTIGNIATHRKYHEILMGEQVIDVLMTAYEAATEAVSDDETIRCIAFCVHNLASDIHKHTELYQKNAYKLLIQFSTYNNAYDRQIAFSTMRMMTSTATIHRGNIMELPHFLSAITYHTNVQANDTLLEWSQLLHTVSLHDSNKLPFSRFTKLIDTIGDTLSTSTYYSALTYIVSALANITELRDTHLYLRNNQLFKYTHTLFTYTDTNLLSEVYRLYANLTSNEENHPAFLQQKGLQYTLTSGCIHGNTGIHTYASLILCNLSSAQDNHPDLHSANSCTILINTYIQPIITQIVLNAKMSDVTNITTATTTATASIITDTTVNSNLSVDNTSIGSTNDTMTVIDHRIIEKTINDTYLSQAQSYAIKTLGNIAMSYIYHDTIISQPIVMESIIHILSAPDSQYTEEVIYDIVYFYNKIVSNKDNLSKRQDSIRILDIIPLICQVIHKYSHSQTDCSSSDSQKITQPQELVPALLIDKNHTNNNSKYDICILTQAISCLKHCCYHRSICTTILTYKDLLLPSFLTMIATYYHMPTNTESSESISGSDNKAESDIPMNTSITMKKRPIYDTVILDDLFYEYATFLSLINIDDPIRIAIAEYPSFISTNLEICKYRNTEVSSQILSAYANIAETKLTHMYLVDTLSIIIPLMNSSVISIQCEAVRCISNLSSSNSLHVDILELSQSGDLLGRLCRSIDDEEVLHNTSYLIQKLYANRNNHRHFYEIKHLLSLYILNNNQSIQLLSRKLSLNALCYFISNPKYKLYAINERILPHIYKIMMERNTDLTIICLDIVRHLSINQMIKRLLVQTTDIMTHIMELIDKSTHIRILYLSLNVLSNISENAENHESLFHYNILTRLQYTHSHITDDMILLTMVKCYSYLSASLSSFPVYIHKDLQLLLELSSHYGDISKYALAALSNLAINSNYMHDIWALGGYQVLFKVLHLYFQDSKYHPYLDTSCRLLCHMSTESNDVLNEMVQTTPVVSILHTLFHISHRHHSLYQYTCMSICNLSIYNTLHPELLHDGLVTAFISTLPLLFTTLSTSNTTTGRSATTTTTTRSSIETHSNSALRVQNDPSILPITNSDKNSIGSNKSLSSTDRGLHRIQMKSLFDSYHYIMATLSNYSRNKTIHTILITSNILESIYSRIANLLSLLHIINKERESMDKGNTVTSIRPIDISNDEKDEDDDDKVGNIDSQQSTSQPHVPDYPMLQDDTTIDMKLNHIYVTLEYIFSFLTHMATNTYISEVYLSCQYYTLIPLLLEHSEKFPLSLLEMISKFLYNITCSHSSSIHTYMTTDNILIQYNVLQFLLQVIERTTYNYVHPHPIYGPDKPSDRINTAAIYTSTQSMSTTTAAASNSSTVVTSTKILPSTTLPYTEYDMNYNKTMMKYFYSIRALSNYFTRKDIIIPPQELSTVYKTILPLLTTSYRELTQSALILLINITKTHISKEVLVQQGVLTYLLKMMKINDKEVQKYAFILLINLASESDYNRQLLIDRNILAILQQLLSHSSLSTVLSNTASTTTATDASVMSSIVSLPVEINVESNVIDDVDCTTNTNDDGGVVNLPVECYEYIAMLLYNLCHTSNTKISTYIGQHQIIDSLYILTSSTEYNTQYLGVSALARLVENTYNQHYALDHNILLYITKLGYSQHMEIQKQVANCLRWISSIQKEKYHIHIIEHCSHVLNYLLISHTNQKVWEYTAEAIKHLSQSICTHTALITAEVTINLVTLLDYSNTLIVQQQTIQAISHLLSTQSYRDYILTTHIATLIHQSYIDDIIYGYHMALSFTKLSTGDNFYDIMVTNRGIQSLLFIITIEDISTQIIALTLLKEIAMESKYQELFSKNDGVSKIIYLSESEDKTVQNLSLSILRLLAQQDSLRALIIMNHVAPHNTTDTHTVIEGADDSIKEVTIKTTTAAATTTTNMTNKMYMTESAATSTTAATTKKQSRRASVKTSTHVAQSLIRYTLDQLNASIQSIAEHQSSQIERQQLVSRDQNQSRRARRRNSTKVREVEHDNHQSTTAMQEDSTSVNVVTANTEKKSNIMVSDPKDISTSSLNISSTTDINPTHSASDKDEDKDIIGYNDIVGNLVYVTQIKLQIECCGLFANMSETNTHAKYMIDRGLGTSLYNLVHQTNNTLELQTIIIRTYTNLLNNTLDIQEKLYSQNCMQALIKLLEDGTYDDTTQQYLGHAYRFLAYNTVLRHQLVVQGYLSPYYIMASSSSLIYKLAAVDSLASMTLSEINHSYLIQFDTVSYLISLAYTEDLSIVKQALFALANISENEHFHSTLLHAGILKLILKINETSYLIQEDNIQYIISRLCSTLCLHKHVKNEVIHTKILAIMSQFISSYNIECQRYTALALCNICTFNHSIPKNDLIQQGILKSLYFLVRYPDPEIMKYATSALSGLFYNASNSIKYMSLIAPSAFGLTQKSLLSSSNCSSSSVQQQQQSSSSTIPDLSYLRVIIKLLEYPEKQMIILGLLLINAICNCDDNNNNTNNTTMSTMPINSTDMNNFGNTSNQSSVSNSVNPSSKSDVDASDRTSSSEDVLNLFLLVDEFIPNLLQILSTYIHQVYDGQVVTSNQPTTTPNSMNESSNSLTSLSYERNSSPTKFLSTTEIHHAQLLQILDTKTPQDIDTHSIINISTYNSGNTDAHTSSSISEAIVSHTSEKEELEIIYLILYTIGSLCEYDPIKQKMIDFNLIEILKDCHICIQHIKIKRIVGYILALLSLSKNHQDTLYDANILDILIQYCQQEDLECQEYSLFSLAHFANNIKYQVVLASMGLVKILVSIISSNQETKHYATLTLMKLANNFENHIIIAEEGGIQSLIKLSKNEKKYIDLQHEASLSTGQLASQAMKILPSINELQMPLGGSSSSNSMNMSSTQKRMLQKAKTAQKLYEQQLQLQSEQLQRRQQLQLLDNNNNNTTEDNNNNNNNNNNNMLASSIYTSDRLVLPYSISQDNNDNTTITQLRPTSTTSINTIDSINNNDDA